MLCGVFHLKYFRDTYGCKRNKVKVVSRIEYMTVPTDKTHNPINKNKNNLSLKTNFKFYKINYVKFLL